MIKIISWFNPLMKELYEMLYQNEYSYVFDSTKFDKLLISRQLLMKQGVKGNN